MTGSVDANPSQTRRLTPGSLEGKLALAERDNAELRAELARLRRNEGDDTMSMAEAKTATVATFQCTCNHLNALQNENDRLRRNMAQCATHLEMAKQALLDDGELDVAEGGN